MLALETERPARLKLIEIVGDFLERNKQRIGSNWAREGGVYGSQRKMSSKNAKTRKTQNCGVQK